MIDPHLRIRYNKKRVSVRSVKQWAVYDDIAHDLDSRLLNIFTDHLSDSEFIEIGSVAENIREWAKEGFNWRIDKERWQNSHQWAHQFIDRMIQEVMDNGFYFEPSISLDHYPLENDPVYREFVQEFHQEIRTVANRTREQLWLMTDADEE